MPSMKYDLVRDGEPMREVVVVYKRHRGYGSWREVGDPGEPGEAAAIEIVDVLDETGATVELSDGEDSEVVSEIEYRRGGF